MPHQATATTRDEDLVHHREGSLIFDLLGAGSWETIERAKKIVAGARLERGWFVRKDKPLLPSLFVLVRCTVTLYIVTKVLPISTF